MLQILDERFYLVFPGVLVILAVGQSLSGYELQVSVCLSVCLCLCIYVSVCACVLYLVYFDIYLKEYICESFLSHLVADFFVNSAWVHLIWLKLTDSISL